MYTEQPYRIIDKGGAIAQAMPVCPKCKKLISPSKFQRHLKRCGVSHKRTKSSLDQSDFFMRI